MSKTDETGRPAPSRRGFLRTATAGTAAAALGLGATGTATAQDGGDFGGWMSDVGNYDGTVTDRTGQDSVTVEVGAQGNGGGFAFAPPAVRVSPGTTITFEWTGEGGQHNVVAEEGADFESELTAEAGFTFEHTFEEPGVVTYFCSPHRSLGMKGAVVVDPSSPGGGGEGGGEEEGGELVLTPELAALGGAVILGVLSPIIFALVLAFRRGRLGSSPEAAGGVAGDRLERVEPTGGGATESEFVTTEAPVAEPETEIGHDEFDPTGTAGMIIVYFLILVLLWIFMYFVEFLGNGPTIIG